MSSTYKEEFILNKKSKLNLDMIQIQNQIGGAMSWANQFFPKVKKIKYLGNANFFKEVRKI